MSPPDEYPDDGRDHRYRVFHLHTTLDHPKFFVTDLYAEVPSLYNNDATYRLKPEAIYGDRASAADACYALNATCVIPGGPDHRPAPQVAVVPQVADTLDETPTLINWDET